MQETNTYKLVEIIQEGTSVLQTPIDQSRLNIQIGDIDQSRLIIQILDKDSRTASDRARAEKARQEIEQILFDLGNPDQRLDFLESFYQQDENENNIVNFSELSYISGSIQGDTAIFNTLDIFDTVKYKAENNFLITSQSNETSLIIGNEYNDFENKQTTTFKNAEVNIFGSLNITEGLLVLEAKEALPDPIKGGLVFTIDNNIFVGTD
jgi:type II secretory pathway component PulJ